VTSSRLCATVFRRLSNLFSNATIDAFLPRAVALLGVYRLIALGCRLRYGFLITQEEPERAAEIIDATLRRPRRRWRKSPPKGG
jgi:hypothetical protein